MNERSLSVCPAIEPFAGGVIGLGIGYSMAPSKYSLQRLLVLSEDKFEKIYSKELAENMAPGEKIALNNIKRARASYNTVKKEVVTGLKNAAQKWGRMFKQVEVPEYMSTAYSESKQNLKKIIEETNYIELNRKYRAAKAALKNSPDDERLKLALKEANTNLANAKAIVSPKIEIYKDCVRNVSKQRLFNVKNEPDKYAGVRSAYHEFLAALANRRTLAANKLFQLSNDKSLNKSYQMIREFLPKARTKSAITGAVALGGLTALLVTMITPKQGRRVA